MLRSVIGAGLAALLFTTIFPVWAIDLDLGVAKICDTCGGGLLGGTTVGPVTVLDPYGTIRAMNSVATDPQVRQSFSDLVQLKGNLPDELQKGIVAAVGGANKAQSENVQELVKSASQIVDATHAIYRFAVRQVNSYGVVLTKAQQRLRDGKVVDALWHLNTDQWQETNKNAAQAAEESAVLSELGQAGASIYGGPAGAAAYAAWLTYNQTHGDVDRSIRAGVYAYLVAYGNANVSRMPSRTLSEVGEKAAMAGAVSGLAVAASGGNSKQSLDAFVKSGGAVLVHGAQSYVQKNYTDTGPSKMDQYCVMTVGKKCADAQKWYKTAKAQLDQLNDAKNIAANIRSSGDGNWAISWNPAAMKGSETGVPAVALTYVGDGSPFKNTINRIAVSVDPNKYSTYWVIYRNAPTSPPFFEYIVSSRLNTSPQLGDEVYAKQRLVIRPAPSNTQGSKGLLKKGTRIKILQMATTSEVRNRQEWIRFSIVSLPTK
jgi:hypothetical protein